MSRRFRVSNYQSTTRVRPFSTSLPIGLTGGWNQIQFNLADFTRRAYGTSLKQSLPVVTYIVNDLANQVRVIWRPFACRSTPMRESAESTSPTDCTRKMKCPRSLNFTSQSLQRKKKSKLKSRLWRTSALAKTRD